MSLCYRSYADLSVLIMRNFDVIAKYKFDLIIGIPRSGMIPALMIALYLNVDCCSFPELLANNKIEKCGSRTIINRVDYPQSAKKILIIEDSYGKGERLLELVATLPEDVRAKSIIAAIYSATKELPTNSVIDFFFEYIPKPRFFEWNIYHHNLVRNSIFDIDGVLCFDPTEEENDDGEAYLSFLLNARPKFIPTLPIHTLVTSRLEKYRKQTEEWLKQHKIIYSHLYMIDLPSKEERKRLNIYAAHKAEVYRNNELVLFFESNKKQSEDIFKLTGKPVFCVESNKLYS